VARVVAEESGRIIQVIAAALPTEIAEPQINMADVPGSNLLAERAIVQVAEHRDPAAERTALVAELETLVVIDPAVEQAPEMAPAIVRVAELVLEILAAPTDRAAAPEHRLDPLAAAALEPRCDQLAAVVVVIALAIAAFRPAAD